MLINGIILFLTSVLLLGSADQLKQETPQTKADAPICGEGVPQDGPMQCKIVVEESELYENEVPETTDDTEEQDPYF